MKLVLNFQAFLKTNTILKKLKMLETEYYAR